MNREVEDPEETDASDAHAGRKLTEWECLVWCHSQKSCCAWSLGTQYQGKCKEGEQGYAVSGFGTGVTATKVIPFDYLHCKKGDDNWRDYRQEH